MTASAGAVMDRTGRATPPCERTPPAIRHSNAAMTHVDFCNLTSIPAGAVAGESGPSKCAGWTQKRSKRRCIWRGGVLSGAGL
jgi:hypothetical protein